MPAQTSNIFLLDELDDIGRTSGPSENDLTPLRTVAEWVTSYIVKPHEDFGRANPVCPFVPAALERAAFPDPVGARARLLTRELRRPQEGHGDE